MTFIKPLDKTRQVWYNCDNVTIKGELPPNIDMLMFGGINLGVFYSAEQ